MAGFDTFEENARRQAIWMTAAFRETVDEVVRTMSNVQFKLKGGGVIADFNTALISGEWAITEFMTVVGPPAVPKPIDDAERADLLGRIKELTRQLDEQNIAITGHVSVIELLKAELEQVRTQRDDYHKAATHHREAVQLANEQLAELRGRHNRMEQDLTNAEIALHVSRQRVAGAEETIKKLTEEHKPCVALFELQEHQSREATLMRNSLERELSAVRKAATAELAELRASYNGMMAMRDAAEAERESMRSAAFVIEDNLRQTTGWLNSVHRQADELAAALLDNFNGWRRLRARCGDIPGVNWDRREHKAAVALVGWLASSADKDEVLDQPPVDPENDPEFDEVAF